jgi:virulence factor Mce-like protein
VTLHPRFYRVLTFVAGVGVLVFGTIAVIQVFVVAMGARIVPHITAPYTVGADFPDALGIRVGQQVLENGGVVGQVSGVEVRDRHAHVDMEFDSGKGPIHDTSSAQIFPTSQVGHPVVELDDPGYGNELPSHRTLPLSRNHIPVYIDDVVSALNGDDRSGLQTVLRELGAAVDGRGQDIRTVTADTRDFLAGLTPISQQLSADIDHIGGILDHSHAVMGQLARSNIDSLIGDLGRLGATVAAQNPRLSSTLNAANADLGTVNQMLKGNEGNALHALSSLPPAINAVDKTVTDFMPLLVNALVPDEADIVQLIIELQQSFARVGSDGQNFLKVAVGANNIRSLLGGAGHGPGGFGSSPNLFGGGPSPSTPDSLLSILFGG